jgi:putative ABC transport system permease protein
VQGPGSPNAPASRGPWWRSPLWRKAPVALAYHRSALVAVAIAGFLVALAASSAPFVTTASASSALKNDLSGLSPLATGLDIQGTSPPVTSVAAEARVIGRRRAAIRTLRERLDLEAPVFTEESQLPVAVSSSNGDQPVILMARSGALGHVKILSQTSGDGVWVPDLTAAPVGVRPGGKIKIAFSEQGTGTSGTLAVRVKGIYEALDRTIPDEYWANLLPEIFPQGADPPPPQRFVLMSPTELYTITRKLSNVRTIRANGRVFRVGEGPMLATMAELAVSPKGLTLPRARALAQRFGALRHSLPTSTLGKTLGCTGRRLVSITGSSPTVSPCPVTSSLSAAVAIADQNASQISAAVTLLAGAGTLIALAVAGAAGMFLVRRRSAEASLLFARGENVAAFAGRTCLELLLPTLAGAAAGFALALSLTSFFAPSGSIDSSTLHSALARGGLAAAAGLLLAAGVAAAMFVRQFDSGTRRARWLRFFPWELVLLAIALWLLHEVETGGGLAGRTSTAAGHPTLAVFLFPLLLVAAVAGLVTRVLRFALRPRPGRGAGLAVAPFFALRRLSAARGLLTALLVVSAVAFGAYFYAEALATSLTHNVSEKAYVAYGGDVQGLAADSTPLPRSFPYPVTELDYANQSATLGGVDGASTDVMAVDPATLGSVIRWYGDWGADPRPSLGKLDSGGSAALPAIASDTVPLGTKAIWLQDKRVPIHVIARVASFPGMTAGTALVVVSRNALNAFAARAKLYDPLGEAQTFIWAKGPPAPVAAALEAAPIRAYYVTTIDAFRQDPDVLLATKTFSYMRLIALAAGVLVFVALLLYLQARQRSQAVASALAVRMGLQRSTEIISLALELAAIALVAAVVGGVVAIAAAGPITRHIDPLPTDSPPPSLVIPVGAIVGSAIALVVVGIGAAALTSRLTRRTNMSEALRVA